MSSKTLRLVPLGGLGEVGKNMMALEYGENILVIDAGMMFPENDMLGIDYIIPDFRYLLDKKHKVRGIIVTHGHEDHTGAIRHLLEQLEAPIYSTPLTQGLIEAKLSRNGLLGKASLHTVHAGDRIPIGPFSVEFFHVCHSIPDGVGLGITTPAASWFTPAISSLTILRLMVGRRISASWVSSAAGVCWPFSPIPPTLRGRAGRLPRR